MLLNGPLLTWKIKPKDIAQTLLLNKAAEIRSCIGSFATMVLTVRF